MSAHPPAWQTATPFIALTRHVGQLKHALLALALLALALLALLCLPSRVQAQGVELAFWQHHYQGQIAGKPVAVDLLRLGEQLSGRYCYQPCTAGKYLQLNGTLSASGLLALTETEADNSKTPHQRTGQWQATLAGASLSGRWQTPDGQRNADLVLTQQDANPATPYDIRLLTSGPLPEKDDCSSKPPAVIALRLYRQGRLVQELEAESQGTCTLFLPEVVDANFDGHPDLMLAKFLPAAPNIPYQFWLYNPRTGLFDEATDMENVTSPQFDPAYKKVWSFWRSSCCEHGVTLWHWQGKALVEEATRSSYLLPVLDGKTRRYCYVTPSYDKGQIEFPERVEQDARGQLRLTLSDLSQCETGDTDLERVKLEVWQQASAKGHWRVAQQWLPRWKQVRTAEGPRLCPEVPFFDRGRIRHIVLKDAPELCTRPDSAPPP